MYREYDTKIEKLGERIRMAFKFLREEKNVDARFNFACCGSCAGYEIATDWEQQIENGEAGLFEGCVFFHSQANDRRLEGGAFYLSYGNVKVGEKVIGNLDENVGAMVVEALGRFYVETEWDGDPKVTIKVLGVENQPMFEEVE